MNNDHPEVCELCGTGAHVGVALYRKNAKGIDGIFRCIPRFDVEPTPAAKESNNVPVV